MRRPGAEMTEKRRSPVCRQARCNRLHASDHLVWRDAFCCGGIVTVTWGQDRDILQHGDATARAKRAGGLTARAFAALLALAAYVVTFAFAGNGCWLDVASAVGVSAIVGYGMLLCAQ